MKVLTIKQPWASLIMLGYKRFEFRSWKTNYRGELLIYTDSTFNENYGWQMEDIEVFDEPIEAKGHLSLWEFEI